MIVNICRGADSRWSVYVDGRMAPISACRQRRSAILLAGEAGSLNRETMHELLAMDAREEAVNG